MSASTLRTLGFVAVSCSLVVAACDEKPKERLSAVGESCVKTADCVEGARCREHVCVEPGASASPRPSSSEEAAPSAPPPSGKQRVKTCKKYRDKVGKWRFTTMVVSGKSKGVEGVNGFYEMEVRASPECSLTAQVAKTGYASKTFEPDYVQVGSAPLRPWGDPRNEWQTRIDLASAKGATLSMAFYFRFDGRNLYGTWHYEGDDWDKAEMGGGLVGKKGVGDQVPFVSLKQLPRQETCAIERCGPSGGFGCDGIGFVMCMDEDSP